MTRTRMNVTVRKAQIIHVACDIANKRGLHNVSYLTIEPKCDNIKARGIRYHYPNKKCLYQAMIDSGFLQLGTLIDATEIGLIKSRGDGEYEA